MRLSFSLIGEDADFGFFGKIVRSLSEKTFLDHEHEHSG